MEVNVFNLVDKLARGEVVHVEVAWCWASSLFHLVGGDRVCFSNVELPLEVIWEVHVDIVEPFSLDRKLLVQRRDHFHILLDHHAPELF